MRTNPHRHLRRTIGAQQFIYFLRDERGDVLYVGRAADVARRIRQHYYEASNPDITKSERKALWLMDVRSVDVVGPFLWDAAVAMERHYVETFDPFGNLRMTPRDPQVAGAINRGAAA